MKTPNPFPPFFTALALVSIYCLVLVACTTTPAVAPTAAQTQVAAAVEDALSIGLVPVFTKNASYIPAAQGVSAALAVFDGNTITPEDVNAVLAKTNIAPADAAIVANVVNAAWNTYQRRYAQQVSATVRPDVKLFLSAVSAGIQNAVAACTPPPQLPTKVLPQIP